MKKPELEEILEGYTSVQEKGKKKKIGGVNA